MRLRDTFSRKLKKALGLLEQWNTPISLKTKKIIEKKRVALKKLTELPYEEFKGLSAHDKELSKVNIHDYALSKERLNAKACDNYCGLYASSTIYVAEHLTTKLLAVTLIHEVNHFLNKSDHYVGRGDQENFKEEYRAHVAERLGQSNVITRGLYQQCAETVERKYDVKAPKQLKPPTGAFLKMNKRRWRSESF